MSDENTDHETEAERAFKALFRRMGRIAIDAGVTAPVAYRLMKEALVEAAEQDFPLEQRRLTDSRISMLTGVHRKDVRVMRDDTAPLPKASDAPRKPSVLATVIGRWLGDPAYLDDNGEPRALPRQAEDAVSFDDLVVAITSDIRPRTLLDELVRKGAVAVDDKTDIVTLTNHAMIGSSPSDDGYYFLERNVGDHIAAVAENMTSDGTKTPLLERAVFYNGLTAEAVDELEQLCRKKGAALVEDVNRAAVSLQKQGGDDPDADERFRFGVYFYRENEGQNAADDGVSE